MATTKVFLLATLYFSFLFYPSLQAQDSLFLCLEFEQELFDQPIIFVKPLSFNPGDQWYPFPEKHLLRNQFCKDLISGQYSIKVKSINYHPLDTSIWIFKDQHLGIHLKPIKNTYNFQHDLEQGKLKLFISTGSVPRVSGEREIRKIKGFKRKYQVELIYQGGCIILARNNYQGLYNQQVRDYLNENYGRKWRKLAKQIYADVNY